MVAHFHPAKVSLPIVVAEPSRLNSEGGQTGIGVLLAAKLVTLLRSRVDDSRSSIHVEPLVITKGKVMVSIYALEHVPQETLEILLSEKKLTFGEPKPDPGTAKKIFAGYKILIINQRRQSSEASDGRPDLTASCKREAQAMRNLDRLIPIHFDLILWGNDRRCDDAAEQIDLHGEPTLCYQPGAVTATRYTDSQASPKFVTIVEMGRSSPIEIDFIRLRSVRPMILSTLEVDDVSDIDGGFINQFEEPFEEKCLKQVRDKVQDMLATAKLRTSLSPR